MSAAVIILATMWACYLAYHLGAQLRRVRPNYDEDDTVECDAYEPDDTVEYDAYEPDGTDDEDLDITEAINQRNAAMEIAARQLAALARIGLSETEDADELRALANEATEDFSAEIKCGGFLRFTEEQ